MNTEKRSNIEKTEPPQRVSRTSSTRGIAIWGISVTSFSFCLLTVIQIPPDSFVTLTRGLDPHRYGVLDETGSKVRVYDGVCLL